jgi:hypothetical protein
VTEDWTVPAWTVMSALGVLLLLGIGLLVAIARTRSRTAAALEAAHTEAAALQAQVDAIERRLAQPPPAAPREEPDYVITHLGEERTDPDPDPVPAVAAPLFADLVLRESVVQAASLAAGLRRALAPEMRHKIRFEMRREVKRARKQRRADLRDARRAWEAQQRADQGAGQRPGADAA